MEKFAKFHTLELYLGLFLGHLSFFLLFAISSILFVLH